VTEQARLHALDAVRGFALLVSLALRQVTMTSCR
jgi:hypothetical protein